MPASEACVSPDVEINVGLRSFPHPGRRRLSGVQGQTQFALRPGSRFAGKLAQPASTWLRCASGNVASQSLRLTHQVDHERPLAPVCALEKIVELVDARRTRAVDAHSGSDFYEIEIGIAEIEHVER